MTIREVVESGDTISFHVGSRYPIPFLVNLQVFPQAVSDAVAMSGTPYHNEYMVIVRFKPSTQNNGLPKFGTHWSLLICDSIELIFDGRSVREGIHG
jgi:hypothetical protein